MLARYRTAVHNAIWTLGGVLLATCVAIVLSNLQTSAKTIAHEIVHAYGIRDPEFARSVGTLLGPALVPGNHVSALYNGDEIFPAMLDAIASATRSVTFETYIYWSGGIGRAFGEALAERARAGVRVHVLLDWMGSGKIDGATITGMQSAGVEVERYRPPRWYGLGRLNHRTHRKLLVVDGRVGFTGGVGIADNWMGHAQDPDHWRDSHFRLEGPAVAQMQAAFMDNWIEARGVVLHGDDYFPPLATAGDEIAQVFKSSAGEASESVRFLYLLSIACAEKNVRIANAYFVPGALSVTTLVAAARRGVDVEIIVPGRHTDAIIVRRASRAFWGPLLEAGVSIYEYQPTMYHTKVMTVDDLWTSVGSTNFDSRSFRLNDEANLNVLDAGFARSQAAKFEEDKRLSRRITLATWRRRPWAKRMIDSIAGWLRPQL
jgi:cardiolipin synthase